ncbi:MAG TPA: glutamine cyclotransferase [Halieaceae bacterium]|nr:glutamine cyclotransferase [Halieaceae bacterium]
MKCIVLIALLASSIGTVVLASTAPLALSYRVIDQAPQSRAAFVQGFTFDAGDVLLGTGGYGESLLQRIDAETHKVMQQEALPRRYFGEGVAVSDDRILQLTWRSGVVLVRDRTSLKVIGQFQRSGESWGITRSPSHLIVSDGSATLSFYHPAEFELSHQVDVSEAGKPLPLLNELEWIDGLIWANIWYQDRIVAIDPNSGEVLASLDLTGLLPKSERAVNTDVLNGIAYDPRSDAIWVTGKRWPWRYRIEITPARPKGSAH